MKYFTLEELIKSETAELLHIKNNPIPEVKKSLEELGSFLDTIREAWGSPIIVTSGYRCKALNKAVGGSPTSAHQLGFAVDIVPQNQNMKEFKAFIVDFLKDKDFDQCIIEKKGDTEWIHIGLYSFSHLQRKMIFNITK